jgi:GntR family transcriptional repressor for pyruvate dehydrogenase complex
MFIKAKQNRVFEDIISQIQESILQGELSVGDKLPSERQLREIFKVSRGTLREALRALEQKGLLTIKTGVQGGAVVCPVDTKLMGESLALLLRYQKISLRELAEFREEVEGLVAAKAAQKAKKEDIKQLDLFLESFKAHLDASEFNWNEIIKEDNKFHLFLARIAGNRVFESVLNTVYENIFPYFERFLSKERALMRKNYKDLCKILEAIEKRDSNKAKVLVQDHVKRFNQMMEKGEKQHR